MSPAPVTTNGLLSDADFERFREYFYKRTGIQFAPVTAAS